MTKNVRVRQHQRKLKNGKIVPVKAHNRTVKGSKRSNSIRKQSLFTKGKYEKYDEMVSFKSYKQAKDSAEELAMEYAKSKTKEKKLRIARVTQYSANRARAMSRKKNLSKEEKKELKKVANAYGYIAVQMWSNYRKLK